MPADAAEIVRLAERVEQAVGPDAELSALIRCAIFAPEGAYVAVSPFNGLHCIFLGETRDGRPKGWEPRGLTHEQRMGDFTASLDAAMALVPEGQATECLNDATETLGVAGWNGRWRDALPRFLTAAALRARAAQHDHEVG